MIVPIVKTRKIAMLVRSQCPGLGTTPQTLTFCFPWLVVSHSSDVLGLLSRVAVKEESL